MTRLTVSVLLVIAVACGDSTSPERPVSPGDEFTLGLGEAATVASTGLEITFIHVLQDSRCPPIAYCIWAGNATVVLEVTREDMPAEFFRLCTISQTCSAATTLDGHEVAMLELEPPSRPPSALDYLVTLRVTAE